MLPVVIIAGVGLALLVRVRQPRVLVSHVFNYVFNALVLVIVSLAVFAPLGRYMVDLPQSFWQRSSGRLFGEDTIEIKDERGGVIGLRVANNQDRVEALTRNLPVLNANLQKSMWMFNWQGDRAWITGSPAAEPQLDTFAGSFFILGLGLMLVRAIKRRDPADWLLPLSILIMLLPTALSIAFVIEVPSATRAAGTFPMVYFVAAFAIALSVRMVLSKLPIPAVRYVLYAVVILGILFGALSNWDTYFGVAMRYYRDSTLPHRVAGRYLLGFSETVGSSGNAFMVNFPNWLDHRAIAIEANDIRWNNGILEDNLKLRLLNQIAGNIGTPYELRPDRQLLFFLHQEAADSLLVLQEMFPNGVLTQLQTHQESRDFMVYTVQPVGCAWVLENIEPPTTLCSPPT
jgi:hypothetical protein